MIDDRIITKSTVQFESTACPNCGHHEPVSLYTFTDSYGSYAIVRCSICSLSYLNPRPTPETIGVYYEAAQYTPFLSSGNATAFFSRLYSTVRKYSVRWKRKKIEKIRSGTSLLDIGCGTGEFLLEMKNHGWKVYGIEPSEEASQFARTTYKLDVQNGSLDIENMQSLPGPFDVITLWHALEHIHRPLDALALIREKLSDEGLLLIALPNIDSFDAGVYKKGWIALDVPRHLLHFTSKSLSSILKRSGLEVFHQHQMPLDTVFNSIMSERSVLGRHAKYLWPVYLIRLLTTVAISWLNGIRREKGSSIMYYIRKTKN